MCKAPATADGCGCPCRSRVGSCLPRRGGLGTVAVAATGSREAAESSRPAARGAAATTASLRSGSLLTRGSCRFQDAEKCVSMQPKWSKGYSRLGLAKFKSGDLAGAIKAYTTGLSHDPDNTQISDGLTEVRFSRSGGGAAPRSSGPGGRHGASTPARHGAPGSCALGGAPVTTHTHIPPRYERTRTCAHDSDHCMYPPRRRPAFLSFPFLSPFISPLSSLSNAFFLFPFSG